MVRDSGEKEARAEARRLCSTLRASAASGASPDKSTLLEAAAMIEGHLEAFAVVVNDKAGLQAALKHAERCHQNTLEIVSRWRELLDVLAQESPGDIRLKRARLGEHPLRPAAWERANAT